MNAEKNNGRFGVLRMLTCSPTTELYFLLMLFLITPAIGSAWGGDRRVNVRNQYSFEMPENWAPVLVNELRGRSMDMTRAYGRPLSPYLVLQRGPGERLPYIAFRPLPIRGFTVGQVRVALRLGFISSEVGGVFTNGISPGRYRWLKFDKWDRPPGLYCDFLAGRGDRYSVSTFLFPMRSRWHEVTLVTLNNAGDYRPMFRQLVHTLKFNPEYVLDENSVIARQKGVALKQGFLLLLATGLAVLLWYGRRTPKKVPKKRIEWGK